MSRELTPTEMEKSKSKGLGMKGKIGVVLVFSILVLPTLANAEETTKVYSYEELEVYERDGWEIKIQIGPTYFSPDFTAKVGNVVIDGTVQVNIIKEITGEPKALWGYVSNYPVYVSVYKNDLQISSTVVPSSDNKGHFNTTFILREPGYYKIVFESREFLWSPYNNTFAIYVSEKDSDDESHAVDSDSDGVPDPYDYAPHDRNIQTIRDAADTDGDGVPDQYDYDPYDPDVQSRNDLKMPGFEAVCAIAGLLAVVVLFRRRRYIK